MSQNIWVIKESGEKELFDEDKVRSSLERAGIPREYEEQVVNHVKKGAYQNIPTSEIYGLVSGFLGKAYPLGKDRYSLKRAIMEIGPTGYPFEKFVAELLKQHGYTVAANTELLGACVTHEVDVLARKDKRVYFVECKYHNQIGLKCDIKIPLYVKARSDDLAHKLSRTDPGVEFGAWIFSNTKFSSDAITYAECVKMRLTGWSYPDNGNLQDMVESKKLYPVTTLNSLSQREKQILVENGILLASELADGNGLRDILRLKPQVADRVRRECDILLG